MQIAIASLSVLLSLHPLPLAAAAAHANPPVVAAALAAAGDNRTEIERALAEVPPEQRASMEWLVAHMPAQDLATLDAAFLLAHVDGAFKAWKAAPWSAQVDEDTFRDAILPYASVSEKRELWLPVLREKCLPMVAAAKSPAEAAVILNTRIFPEWKVQYSTKRMRADQAPSESMESGLASCTGLSILLVNACRSVGIPARFVGVPLWTDGSGNHSWVEVWDGERWRYTGAAEPTGDRLDEGWFTGRAATQNRDKPEHAIYAVTWRDTGVEFPMVFDRSRPRARAVDVTDRYRARSAALPEGQRVLRVLARDPSTGSRVRAEVEVLGADGTVIGGGRTNDETRDLNDHLEIAVPIGADLSYRIDGRSPASVGGGKGGVVELTVPRDAASASIGPVDELRAFLASGSIDAVATQPWANAPISREEAAAALEVLSAAHRASLEATGRAAFDARVLEHDGARMPFWYEVYGEKPEGGRSLYISMHGGGGAPKEVNDRQWENQKRLYRPEEGVYVAPRAPTDTWNLWHQGHIDPLFRTLIAKMIAFEGVDPDKVYLMGYSAGGDGVYQLAPRMADSFAAAAMMAGHPNETRPDGLRNLPFALYMGGKDAAFNRNQIARDWKVALADLAAKDPGGYPHEVTIFEENGHWMERKDAVAVPWMAKFTRDLRPEKLVWLQDDVTSARFYWLRNTAPKGGQRIVARRDGQKIVIDAADGVQSLSVLLDDAMLDLDKPVEVAAGSDLGAKVQIDRSAQRTIATLARTLLERGDPKGAFSAEVAIRIERAP
ncbi:MAG: polyhydroxyalkanoate depolymerase [Phycisphaera sp.]|nr:polyhydroxyalkanoate depolymerase [Phycisphaera sp.]